MENLQFFAVTMLSFLVVLLVEWASVRRPTTKDCAKLFAIVALLCVPIDINGHVFTVIGNAVGEKGVYSLTSFYQRTDGVAITVFGLGGYQRGGEQAITVAGFNSAQVSERGDTVLAIGFAGYQRAGEKAHAVIALAIYQKVENENWSAERAFGMFTSLAQPKTAEQEEIIEQ